MPSLRERLEGGVWGLLVGDALGVPYEFHAPSALPPLAEIELTPPPSFRRAHGGVPPGTWSDDGAHALCLLASLLHCGKLDVGDLGKRLSDWHRHGYLAVDGVVFDIGIQTAAALRAMANGVPAEKAGGTGERENGNGSLMRVLPLALWHQGSDEELVRDAQRQSLPTHGHPRSQVCCALYCLWARGVLREVDAPFETAVATLRGLYAEGTGLRRELDEHVWPEHRPAPRGTGYVVDCLHSAHRVLEQPGYELVVKHAVALGNDTDTTACVAGGLAGAREGVGAIPERWMSAMRGRELVEPLVASLLAARGP